MPVNFKLRTIERERERERQRETETERNACARESSRRDAWDMGKERIYYRFHILYISHYNAMFMKFQWTLRAIERERERERERSRRDALSTVHWDTGKDGI